MSKYWKRGEIEIKNYFFRAHFKVKLSYEKETKHKQALNLSSKFHSIDIKTSRWESAGTAVNVLRKFLFLSSSRVLRSERCSPIPIQLVHTSDWSRS